MSRVRDALAGATLQAAPETVQAARGNSRHSSMRRTLVPERLAEAALSVESGQRVVHSELFIESRAQSVEVAAALRDQRTERQVPLLPVLYSLRWVGGLAKGDADV